MLAMCILTPNMRALWKQLPLSVAKPDIGIFVEMKLSQCDLGADLCPPGNKYKNPSRKLCRSPHFQGQDIKQSN